MRFAGKTAEPQSSAADAAAVKAGFIDALARREYFQMAAAAFFVSFMYSHAAPLGIRMRRCSPSSSPAKASTCTPSGCCCRFLPFR
jgi:hypothetical protein